MEDNKKEDNEKTNEVVVTGVMIGNVYVFNSPVTMMDGDTLVINFTVKGAKAIINQVGVLTE